MAASAQRLRYQIDRSKSGGSIADFVAGQQIFFWNGNDIQIELGIFNAATLDDISWIASITVEVKESEVDLGSPLMSKTVLAVDLNPTLTEDQWIAGADQHGIVYFTHGETLLDLLGGASKSFWIVISAKSNDTPYKLVTLGGGYIAVIEDATPATTVGPVQAGNLLPGGAIYDGSGAYSFTVIANENLSWAQGANDTNVVNGGQTVTVSDTIFVTQGTSIVLHGTASQPVTAVLRKDVFLTADQSDGRYLQAGTVLSTVLLKANNLSDLASAATSRTNLGLDTAAVHPVSFFLQSANNLSDLANAATARANLGLGTASTQSTAFWLQTANNLSDLVSASAARTNLGLSGAALLAVGTTAGTVSAGDDSRITGAAQKSANLSD